MVKPTPRKKAAKGRASASPVKKQSSVKKTSAVKKPGIKKPAAVSKTTASKSAGGKQKVAVKKASSVRKSAVAVKKTDVKPTKVKKPVSSSKSATVKKPTSPQKTVLAKAGLARKTEISKKTVSAKRSEVVKKPDPARRVELDEFLQLLEVLRGRLRGDVTQLTNEALGVGREEISTESKSPTHMAELGSDTFEQDFALSIVENEQETLSEIGVAIEKIKVGSYGQCEGCLAEGKSASQSTIPKARLRAIPYARNCVGCERKKESY